MNHENENPKAVTRTLIPEDQRLSHTAKIFGAHWPMLLEPVVFSIAGHMSDAYRGGYWNFYILDNDGFYAAPDCEQVFQVSCDNYFTGELSADALGIVSCLYAYSHCSFSKDKVFGRLCTDHYHLLRAIIFEHPEVAAILGAID